MEHHKKLFTIIALLVYAMSAWSQGDQRMNRLMEFLKDKEDVFCTLIINNNIRLTRSFLVAGMYNGENASSKNHLELIMSALNDSRSNSKECCWWEKHSNGNDSMDVSIAFPRNGADNIIYSNRNGRRNLASDEYATFHYYTQGSKQKGTYDLKYFCVEDANARGTQPLTAESYEQAVFPIFNDKSIHKTAVNWIHDETYSDKADIKTNYLMTSTKLSNDTYSTGSTTGSIFTIPASEKELAEKTLEKLMASTSEYLGSHPEQQYTLYPYLKGSGRNVPASFLSSGSMSNVQYDVMYASDDDGYHFLFIKTDGALWIPKQYSMLKSIKNNKKSFLKNKKK